MIISRNIVNTAAAQMTDEIYRRPYSRDFTRYSPWKQPDCGCLGAKDVTKPLNSQRLQNDRYLSFPYSREWYKMNCCNQQRGIIMSGTPSECGCRTWQGFPEIQKCDGSNFCNPSFDSQVPGM